MESDRETTEAYPVKSRSKAMTELTRRYLADLPLQLAAMRDCATSGDRVALQRQAHRAKGTSATFRLEKLAAQFARLEAQACAHPEPDLGPLLDHLAVLIAEAAHRVEREGEPHV